VMVVVVQGGGEEGLDDDGDDDYVDRVIHNEGVGGGGTHPSSCE